MKNSDLCVSAKALELDGATPVVGDEVEVTIKGKVTRAENGEVYIKPETANGQPIEDKTGEGAEKPGAEPDEKQLRDMAASADNQEG